MGSRSTEVFARSMRRAACALSILGASIVGIPATAGAAASMTAAFDPATCDLVVNGTGFTAADMGTLTQLQVLGGYYTGPLPHTAFNKFVPLSDVLDDGAWTLRVPAADVGTRSGTIYAIVSSSSVTLPELFTPCTRQPAYLDASGLILGGQQTLEPRIGPVDFEVTVSGFLCYFSSQIANIDGTIVLAGDHLSGSCLAPPGVLPTGPGEVAFVVVWPGTSGATGGPVTGATTVGTICGSAVCITATGPMIATPICRTTMTTYFPCDPIAISIEFSIDPFTTSTPPNDAALYYVVTTDSGEEFRCAAIIHYRSLGGGRYDAPGPAVGECGTMRGSTSVISVELQAIGSQPSAGNPPYYIGPYPGEEINCTDPTVECSWRLPTYVAPTTSTTTTTTSTTATSTTTAPATTAPEMTTVPAATTTTAVPVTIPSGTTTTMVPAGTTMVPDPTTTTAASSASTTSAPAVEVEAATAARPVVVSPRFTG